MVWPSSDAPGQRYGVEAEPPSSVTWISAFQHVGVMA
jgi:hypothetical protein